MPAAPASEYTEIRPAPALAPWAACGWTWRAGPAGRAQRVVPDGCVDLVWIDGEGLLLVGANTTAFTAAIGPGALAAGVRLRPGAGPALLGVAAEALRDARVPAGDVWGPGPQERVAAAPGPAALAAELARRRPDAAPPDPLVQAAVARLARPAGAVTTVAAELGVSERHLRRRVTAAVGYGPKRLARVLRLQRALAAIAAGEGLAGAAYGAGYADQAHFSGECRALAGVPPSALGP
jgi:AraC-like DNA-binding protein